MPRPLYEIAEEIHRSWRPVYFGAVPYLAAMCHLENIDDTYGDDSARSIVTYFLSNAAHWRGGAAKGIKNELKEILGIQPRKIPDSWKAEVLAEGETKYLANDLRFATKAEAQEYAKDLYKRWSGFTHWRAKKCANKVNAKWEGHLIVTD